MLMQKISLISTLQRDNKLFTFHTIFSYDSLTQVALVALRLTIKGSNWMHSAIYVCNKLYHCYFGYFVYLYAFWHFLMFWWGTVQIPVLLFNRLPRFLVIQIQTPQHWSYNKTSLYPTWNISIFSSNEIFLT
jgi:hypothetical protein